MTSRKLFDIIIPFAKIDRIEGTLQSLVAQSNTDFSVILASDGPTPELAPNVRRLARELDVTFVSYPSNVGSEDPSRHWERCVGASKSDWIWLLGDDDRASRECAAHVASEIRRASEDLALIRLPVGISFGADNLPSATPGEEVLTWSDFLAGRLDGKLHSFASEYVIKVEALRAAGGFVPFPYGWCSDDATWLQLARYGGIRQIHGESARVFWTHSSFNTSSLEVEQAHRFSEAEMGFLRWLREESPVAGEMNTASWKFKMLKWFSRQTLRKKYDLLTGFRVVTVAFRSHRTLQLIGILIHAFDALVEAGRPSRRGS